MSTRQKTAPLAKRDNVVYVFRGGYSVSPAAVGKRRICDCLSVIQGQLKQMAVTVSSPGQTPASAPRRVSVCRFNDARREAEPGIPRPARPEAWAESKPAQVVAKSESAEIPKEMRGQPGSQGKHGALGTR
ncbi:hypothetical protein AAFF_G00015080 [Aldrovandia affinis]|uniref:Uncharacterized protein n=1 Tax=Aldrovandia affinis TaxID=143900 RepID=A0AAD7S621_9TELE|nr:hypothetical protein AAFF_G00015080 [Aldrovandia affinis]